jgi:pimeloyl-ACP methyl ester carboxylesterase
MPPLRCSIAQGFADVAQLVFFDQHGLGRSDHGQPDQWNLATWTADDLLDLTDRLGLDGTVNKWSYVGRVVSVRVNEQSADPADIGSRQT